MKIKFEQKVGGLSATINGMSAWDVSQKVDACKDGNCACDCDPAMMQKIENIEVSSSDEGAKITIMGDVSVETLAPMMQSCLIKN